MRAILFSKGGIIGIFLVAAGLIAGYFYLSQGPSTPAELASYLPDKEGTLIYIDVNAMRRAGILNILAGSKAAEETEYKQFVEQTGFDYQHDLDTLAATFRSDQIFFVLRGRFGWEKLAQYAAKHGGACKGSYCVVDGSQPGRRVSYYKLRTDLMAMAVSGDDMAAYQVARNASKVNPFTPESPVWVMMPSQVLKETSSFPPGIRSFAMALENADRAIFSVSPDGDHLKVDLEVACPNVEAASALLVQLEGTTNTLRKLLAREHQAPNPADLSGVLAAGTFRRDDRKIVGQWPIQKVFVDAIGASR